MVESEDVRKYLNQVQKQSQMFKLSKAIYTCACNIDELNQEIEKIKNELKILNLSLEPIKKEAFKTIKNNKTADALNTGIEEYSQEQDIVDDYIGAANLEDLEGEIIL